VLRYVILALLLAMGLAAASGTAVAGDLDRLGTVIALAYSADGRFLAAGDDVRRFAPFRPDDGTTAPGFAPRELDSRILALRFTLDDQHLVVVTASALHIFDLQAGTEAKPVLLATTAAALSADAHFVAFSDGDQVAVLDTRNGNRIQTIPKGVGFPETLAFSPDRRFLAVGAQETMMTLGGPAPHGVASGDLLIIDLPSGSSRSFKALSPWFSSVGFSADSSRVAAITFDHHEGMAINDYRNAVVNVWDTKSGESVLQAALPEDTSRYLYLSFIGGSATVIATAGASWGGDIAFIDTGTGKIGHAGPFDIPSIFSAALAKEAASGLSMRAAHQRGRSVGDIDVAACAADIRLPTWVVPGMAIEVASCLMQLGLEQYVSAFRDNNVDGDVLPDLTAEDHKAVANTVSRFDGFVAKYMGDGVLIYFGYPQAHEDDAERSVRAGIAVIEAVAKLSGRTTLRTRIGIATGLAVVGDLIGAGASQERGVVGETPHLAARVQGLAEPVDEGCLRAFVFLPEAVDPREEGIARDAESVLLPDEPGPRTCVE
jgi:Adenylate and Guanylate cyclase catalytic domain/SAM domain (Sterile alpha motif)